MKSVTITIDLIASILANAKTCVKGSREASILAASIALQLKHGMVLRARGLMLYFRHTNILLDEGRLESFIRTECSQQTQLKVLKLAKTLVGCNANGRAVMLCNRPDRVASLFCGGDVEFTNDFDEELYGYETERDTAELSKIP